MKRLSIIDYLSLFLFSFVVTVTVMTFIYPPTTRMDFSIYLLVTRIALLHRPLYPLFFGGVPFPYTHPTSLLPFFYPFVFLPLPLASSIWNALSLVGILIGGLLILYLSGKAFRLSTLLIILSSMLLLEPVRESLLFGQNNLVVLLFLFLSFLYGRQELTKNQLLSGSLLGIAGALKIFPMFLILYFLAKKKWISALVSVGVFSMFFVLGTFGHTAYINEYIQYSMSIMKSLRPFPNDQSFSSFLLMFFRFSPIVRSLSMTSMFLFLGGISFVTWSKNKKSFIADFIFFGSVIADAALVITPLAWVHHLVFLIPFGIGLLLQAFETKKISHVVLFFLTFLFFFMSWEDLVLFLQIHGFGYFPLFYFHALWGLVLAIIIEFFLILFLSKRFA